MRRANGLEELLPIAMPLVRVKPPDPVEPVKGPGQGAPRRGRSLRFDRAWPFPGEPVDPEEPQLRAGGAARQPGSPPTEAGGWAESPDAPEQPANFVYGRRGALGDLSAPPTSAPGEARTSTAGDDAWVASHLLAESLPGGPTQEDPARDALARRAALILELPSGEPGRPWGPSLLEGSGAPAPLGFAASVDVRPFVPMFEGVGTSRRQTEPAHLQPPPGQLPADVHRPAGAGAAAWLPLPTPALPNEVDPAPNAPVLSSRLKIRILAGTALALVVGVLVGAVVGGAGPRGVLLALGACTYCAVVALAFVAGFRRT